MYQAVDQAHHPSMILMLGMVVVLLALFAWAASAESSAPVEDHWLQAGDDQPDESAWDLPGWRSIQSA